MIVIFRSIVGTPGTIIENYNTPSFSYEANVDIVGQIHEVVEGVSYNFITTITNDPEHIFEVEYDLYYNADVFISDSTT